MKNRIKLNNFLFFLFILIIGALSLYTIPNFTFLNKAKFFSAQSVAKDLKVISQKPHSIFNPKERLEVRNYLYYRLKELGANPQIYSYDSIPCRFGGHFSIANVYATFSPNIVSDSTQYILLVAHLDSRFFNKVHQDTVYSFGAADDGYGLGVILETLKGALNYKDNWKQGIKVLFTDSEEHELDGMTQFVKREKQELKNVNLVVNIEARGVKGPALLFETSKGNSKIMELYKKANLPYSYSLTSFVYSVLPNDTDFSLVKNNIPGFNFAVIDNLNYYHTDKDNYSNISLNSIAHYGEQIEPIVKEYLTNPKYHNRSSLASDSNNIFFSIPLLGLFNFSLTAYSIFNIVVYFIFLLSIFLLLIKKKISLKNVFKNSLYIIIIALSSLIIGEFIAWIVSRIYDMKFIITEIKYIKYDVYILSFSVILLIACITFYMLKRSNNSPCFIFEFIIALQILLFIFSLTLLVTIKENFFFLIPLLLASLSIIFYYYNSYKVLYLLNTCILVLLCVSFLYNLFIALTIGILGLILMIATLFIILIIFNYLCFVRNRV